MFFSPLAAGGKPVVDLDTKRRANDFRGLFGIEVGSFLKSLDFLATADEERVFAGGGKLGSSFCEDSEGVYSGNFERSDFHWGVEILGREAKPQAAVIK